MILFSVYENLIYIVTTKDKEKIFTFNLYTITSNKSIMAIKVSEIKAEKLII